jgi:hypothetical protein
MHKLNRSQSTKFSSGRKNVNILNADSFGKNDSVFLNVSITKSLHGSSLQCGSVQRQAERYHFANYYSYLSAWLIKCHAMSIKHIQCLRSEASPPSQSDLTSSSTLRDWTATYIIGMFLAQKCVLPQVATVTLKPVRVTSNTFDFTLGLSARSASKPVHATDTVGMLVNDTGNVIVAVSSVGIKTPLTHINIVY